LGLDGKSRVEGPAEGGVAELKGVLRYGVVFHVDDLHVHEFHRFLALYV